MKNLTQTEEHSSNISSQKHLEKIIDSHCYTAENPYTAGKL